MSGRIFWDVDTQYDFMNPDGKLYVPEAETIVPQLAALRECARRHGIRTIASADDHVPEHEEIADDPDFESTFPPHCMRGTRGQAKILETALADPLVIDPSPRQPDELRRDVREHGGDVFFLKHRFDVFTNPNVEPVLDEIDPDEIILFGVALDVCVRYAVEGLLERQPKVRLRVVRDAVKPIDPDMGERLLARWLEQGVELATSEVVLAESHATSRAASRSA